MKLFKKADRVLTIFIITSFIALTGVFFSNLSRNAAADSKNEDTTYLAEGSHFITFYDDNEKLTVKTDAKTVEEAISRADIILNQGDTVEPSLDTEISADNFHINIYRARPVIIEVGATQKYLMTSSRDEKTILKEAGIDFYDGDEIIQVPNENFLETGAANVYKLIRNGGRTVTLEEEIAFNEETIKDFNLDPGVSEVRQLGEVGTRKTVYEIQYLDGVEVSRTEISSEITKEPVTRIVATGVSEIERSPLSVNKGRNRYTYAKPDGTTIERQETYYDLDMSIVMSYCGSSDYSVRDDGVKIDQDGYVIIAANLSNYPRCSVVETSVGLGKVYDTGGFAAVNPEQFDIATDWTNHNGR